MESFHPSRKLDEVFTYNHKATISPRSRYRVIVAIFLIGAGNVWYTKYIDNF